VSVGSGTGNDHGYGPNENFDIQEERLVLDVVEVEFELLGYIFNGCVVFELDLCPSGYARFNRKAFRVEWIDLP